MSDEKRQTRPLPFRLRAKAARRAGGVDPRDEVQADSELRALLGAWEAPAPSSDARARLVASFREQARSREPFWKRLLTASVRVPAPVAACAVVALLGSLLMLAARAPRLALDAPPAVPPAPELRVVEAPATPERVTTRVVYVGRESRPRRAGEGVARLAARGRAGGRAGADDDAAQGPTSYFTRVDMGEFEPPDELKIRVIKKGKAEDED
jgi:hypothetical protein